MIEEIGRVFTTIMVFLIDILLCEAIIIFGKAIYDDYKGEME